MLVKLINSRLGKSFRLSFLNRILKDIVTDEKMYCCHVDSWHSRYICWKDLKEVKENHDSRYVFTNERMWKSIDEGYFNCSREWFDTKMYRVKFLEECIDNCEKNN